MTAPAGLLGELSLTGLIGHGLLEGLEGGADPLRAFRGIRRSMLDGTCCSRGGASAPLVIQYSTCSLWANATTPENEMTFPAS